MDDKNKLSQREVLMADMLIKQDRLEETLEKHNEILNVHTAILNEHNEILNVHTVILNEHTGIMREQTGVLNEHTDMLSEQTGVLNKHSLQFGSILATLDRISDGQNRNEDHFKVAIELFKQMAEDIKDLKMLILSDHESRLAPWKPSC